MSQSIVINGTKYTYDQIIKNEFEAKSDFEISTLSFCQSWLKGERIFNLETSGSTGRPKRIEITRDQMITSAQMTAKALEIQPHATSLVCLDTKFIAGKMMLVRSFVTGMNVIANEPVSNPLQNITADQTIDFAAFVPYQLHIMIEENPEKINQVKTAIVGGGQVNQELKKKLKTIKCQLHETFGMTETLSHIALKKINGDQKSDLFSALPSVELKVDERGCLVIKAPFLAGPIVTNDLVKLVDPNRFAWLGRWDNVINTGGAKVIPEQIEGMVKTLFDELSLPNRFFIAGQEDKVLGYKVCLIVEGDEMSSTTIELLKEKIKVQLSKFEVPKEILFVNKFIETETGKINRKETLNLFPANS